MKFVIWGAGKRGRQASLYVGRKNVMAYIDENLGLCNTQNIDGINIISYDEYLKKYRYIPIIITPKGEEELILKKCYHDNVKWGFKYSDCILCIENIFQISSDRICSLLNDSENVFIYGFNPLVYILYELLLRHGIKCNVLLPSTKLDKDIKRHYREMFKENYISEDMPIKKNYNSLCLNTERVYDPMDSRIYMMKQIDCTKFPRIYEWYENEKIKRFADLHLGERCFIVATGPSITIKDLDILYENNEVCIGVNRIYLAFQKTKWRPKYYAISDPDVTFFWKNDILNLDVDAKFISDIAWNFSDAEVTSSMYKYHFIRQSEKEKIKFSDDFSKGGYVGSTVVYDVALQLAVYMGFKEIYLLGTDCTTSAENKYFYDQYITSKVKKYSLDVSNIMRAYEVARRYADEHGIKIYNATRGGNLEIFERVKFECLFKSGKER